jgi:hypothetical protein
MKRFLPLLIILLFCGYSYSQTQWFFRETANIELQFLTPVDSIKNIYPIDNGITIINEDTVNLKMIHKKYYSAPFGFYKDKIKSYYLFRGRRNDSMTIVLDFCYDKLFQVSFFAKGSYYLNNIKYDCRRILDPKSGTGYTTTSDSVINYGDRIITYGERRSSMNWHGSNKEIIFYYEEDYITAEGYYTISDKKIMDLMPFWCGICNGRRTWEKLEKYLNKAR